jgi:hypothetical protein
MGHRRGRSSVQPQSRQGEFGYVDSFVRQELTFAEEERADLQAKVQRQSEEIVGIKEEIQKRLGPIKEEFKLMFVQRDEARKIKNSIHKLKSAIEILQTQLKSQREDNEDRQKQLEKLQKSPIIPSESGIPRQLNQLFSELWSSLLRKGLSKSQIRKKLTSLTRTEIETWIQALLKSSTQRERGRMTMQAVRNGKVDTDIFMRLLERYQPYPLKEDVESEIEELRLRLAWGDIGSEEIQEILLNAGNSKKEAEAMFLNPPFSLPSETANRFVSWLTKADSIPMNYSDLHLCMSPWPQLQHICTYVTLSLAANNKGLRDLYEMMPIPCSEASLREVFLRKFLLTQDAATILSSQLCANEGYCDLEKLKVLIVIPEINQKEEFLGFLKQLDDNAIGTIIRRSVVLPSSVLTIMRLVSQQALLTSYLSLSDFLAKCESTFSFKASESQRFAVKAECFQQTLTLDALDSKWLQDKLNYLFLTDVDLSGPPVQAIIDS